MPRHGHNLEHETNLEQLNCSLNRLQLIAFADQSLS